MPGILLCCLEHQAHRGAPCLESYSGVKYLRGTLDGILLCRSVLQALDGPASLLFSCPRWWVGRERLW